MPSTSPTKCCKHVCVQYFHTLACHYLNMAKERVTGENEEGKTTGKKRKREWEKGRTEREYYKRPVGERGGIRGNCCYELHRERERERERERWEGNLYTSRGRLTDCWPSAKLVPEEASEQASKQATTKKKKKKLSFPSFLLLSSFLPSFLHSLFSGPHTHKRKRERE